MEIITKDGAVELEFSPRSDCMDGYNFHDYFTCDLDGLGDLTTADALAAVLVAYRGADADGVGVEISSVWG